MDVRQVPTLGLANLMKKITVLMVDDNAVVRKGLCTLLETEGNSEVVGQARNGREAVKMAHTLRPDVILMDIAMPVLNGFEATLQILAANPERYGRVSVPTGAIAEDHTMTLDVMGVSVGFTHGHQIKGGAPTWWVKQAHGRQEIGHADILVTGHYHHLAISESSGRTWMQSPAMDAGSRWYTAQSGASAPAGMLTFLAGESCGDRGWSDLAVL